MAAYKRLSSVTHSIAHHSVSSLSYLHPYLSETCKKMGITTIEIDLLTSMPYPKQIQKNKPLETALNEVKIKLKSMLESEGFKLESLKEAILTFTFNFKENDHYCSICKAFLVSAEGKSYEHSIDYMGRTINT